MICVGTMPALSTEKTQKLPFSTSEPARCMGKDRGEEDKTEQS